MDNNNTKRSFKDSVYEQIARIGKALSSPKRLELLDLLSQSNKTVEVLSKETGMSVANTSQHLQVLHSSRMVASEKSGLYVNYSIADEAVGEFYRTLRVLAEKRIAELEQISREFLENKGSMEPVNKEELLRRIKNGEVTVIDVRPVEEYRNGHLEGAVSVPMEDIENFAAQFDKTKDIVAYCRGPHCVYAIDAVETLRERGFAAYRIEYGIEDWKAHGYSIAAG